MPHEGSGKPGTHQLLVMPMISMLNGSKHTLKKNTEALEVGRKMTDLAINAEKDK